MIPEIHDYLARRGIPFEVHHHQPVSTFEEAKRLLPFPPESLVKSLAFRLSSNAVGIAALRAVDRADYRRISDAFGIRRSDLHAADAEDLREIVGMEAGGVAPIPLPGAVVVIDRKVESLPIVICGTGIRTSSLEIASSVFRVFNIGTFADLRKVSG